MKNYNALSILYSFPYPTRSGYDLRVWNLSRILAARMRLEWLTRTKEALPRESLDEVEEEGIHAHSVIVPKPPLALKLLKGAAFLASPYPVMSAGFYFRKMKTALRCLTATRTYDFIITEGTFLCPYWPAISHSAALRIVDLHDLSVEPLRRQIGIMRPGPRKLIYRCDARRLAHVDEWMLQWADLVLVTSERERNLLRETRENVRVEVVKNGVDTDKLQPLPPQDGTELLFVGDLSYFPNRDAVLFLAREVMPRVRRELPAARCRIIGRAAGPELRALDGVNGIEIVGEVQELEPHYRRAAVCIVPVRVGGGTRLKIPEAMALGRPVVSTTLGAEGLDIEPEQHLLLADDPQGLARAILCLLRNPQRGREMARAARTLVEHRYSWEKIGARTFDVLAGLAEEKAARNAVRQSLRIATK